MLALDLAIDASRAKDFILYVELIPREKHDRTERAFVVEDVFVLPLLSSVEAPGEGIFPARLVHQIRQALAGSATRCLCPGVSNHKTGKYCVMLSLGRGNMPHMVPFEYCEGALQAATPGSRLALEGRALLITAFNVVLLGFSACYSRSLSSIVIHPTYFLTLGQRLDNAPRLQARCYSAQSFDTVCEACKKKCQDTCQTRRSLRHLT